MHHSISAPRRKVPGPFAPQSKPRLNPDEREIVLTIADDEQSWHIFTDSTRLTNRLLRVARQWGVTPERLGVGYQLTLPLKAIRFAAPRRPSPAQRAHLAHLNAVTDPRQKTIPSAADPMEMVPAAGPGSRVEAGADLAEIRLSSSEAV
jgi:hypothetical protein